MQAHAQHQPAQEHSRQSTHHSYSIPGVHGHLQLLLNWQPPVQGGGKIEMDTTTPFKCLFEVSTVIPFDKWVLTLAFSHPIPCRTRFDRLPRPAPLPCHPLNNIRPALHLPQLKIPLQLLSII